MTRRNIHEASTTLSFAVVQNLSIKTSSDWAGSTWYRFSFFVKLYILRYWEETFGGKEVPLLSGKYVPTRYWHSYRSHYMYNYFSVGLVIVVITCWFFKNILRKSTGGNDGWYYWERERERRGRPKQRYSLDEKIVLRFCFLFNYFGKDKSKKKIVVIIY